MAGENPSPRNLDLNLGPLDNSSDDGGPVLESYPNDVVNLEDWLDGPVHRITEVFRHRNQRWRPLWRQVPIPPETRNLALALSGGNERHTGEGSVAAVGRPTEMVKMCENADNYLGDEVMGKKEDGGKVNVDEGTFFDCNICLDLAKDPVVTCCGHLFCWPCIYRWLHHHSEAKECPVCKGEVAMKTVTPIYGRGNNVGEGSVDSSVKIPRRPQARRVESWRQAILRTSVTIPMEEMIRRLGSTFDLNQELSQLRSRITEDPHNSAERNNSLLNRILTSRGLRREQAPALAVPSDDVIDLTDSLSINTEMRDNSRLSSFLLHQPNEHRASTISNFMPVINSADSLVAERLVESYFHDNPFDRNQILLPPVDDRDSISSIAAVIQSESLTVDNAVEIDSTVSLSTSSSRRRNEASRTSDVDSGDSRAYRRRRLH